jgi:imidazolonepropionase-like amidohydrolase
MKPITRTLLLTLLALWRVPAAAGNSFAQTDTQKPLALAHVTVIDCTGAKPKSDQTVVIAGSHIAAIGKSGRVKAPADAQVVDATGKYLIPGLWDMHVHGTSVPHFAELFIANGVTGVRNMFTPIPSIKPVRDAIREGRRIGPRIVAAGRIVDGPKPVWSGSIAVHDAAEGREAVRTVQREGSDFVKVYSLLPRDAYFAIADEAKKQGLPFAGHVPESVSAVEASDAGQKSIEHLTGVLVACSDQEAQLRKMMMEAIGIQDAAASRLARERAEVKALETYSDRKARRLFDRFKKNHTWQCPTLTVLRSMALLNDPEFRMDPRLKYLPSEIQGRWNPENDFRLKARTPQDWNNARKSYERKLQIVGEMRRAGVALLAGTDTLNPYCFPGFSLHDELALMVRAGLTPMEALQAATRNAARFLGREKELGTVQNGKLADLVLLDADPLEDIHNTAKISAVVANGRLLDRASLDQMLADAEAAAKLKTQ